jgi:hypothetical protein
VPDVTGQWCGAKRSWYTNRAWACSWVSLLASFNWIEICLRSLLVGALIGLTVSTYLPAQAKSTQPQIVEQLEQVFGSISELYVEYDLYVTELERTERKLSVIEAISRGLAYSRIVHWYDQSLYPFDDEALDPYLNSYLWSAQGRVQSYETPRRIIISPGNTQKIESPSVERYFGYLGLLSPERVIETGASSPIQSTHFAARDYYLPWALSRGHWSLKVEADSADRACLMRDDEIVTDRIVVDTTTLAILERNIKVKGTEWSLNIIGKDFRDVGGARLPAKLTVHSNLDQTLTLIASKLTTRIPSKYLIPQWPPGSIIVDKSGSIVARLGGGMDLLESTVNRMRLTLGHSTSVQPKRNAYLIIVIVVGEVLAFLLSELWFASKRYRRL